MRAVQIIRRIRRKEEFFLVLEKIFFQLCSWPHIMDLREYLVRINFISESEGEKWKYLMVLYKTCWKNYPFFSELPQQIPLTLETLTKLQHSHQLSVPFENLDTMMGKPLSLDL